ncbi:UNVERIFIED_CONTAM: hypothetical protein K2H54_008695 [Gekko kuhli]
MTKEQTNLLPPPSDVILCCKCHSYLKLSPPCPHRFGIKVLGEKKPNISRHRPEAFEEAKRQRLDLSKDAGVSRVTLGGGSSRPRHESGTSGQPSRALRQAGPVEETGRKSSEEPRLISALPLV